MDRSKLEQAVACYRAELEEHPDNHQMMLRLADLFCRLDDPGEAVCWYLRAASGYELSGRPLQAYALYHRVRSLLERTETEPEGARETVEAGLRRLDSVFTTDRPARPNDSVAVQREDESHADFAERLEQRADDFAAAGAGLLAIPLLHQAMQVRAEHARNRDAQLRLSRKWAAAYEGAQIFEQVGLPGDDITALFVAFARSLGGKATNPVSHRAICFRCGEFKDAWWFSCPACSAQAHSDDASIFLTERVWSPQQLAELSERVKRGDDHGIPPELARLMRQALEQQRTRELGSGEPDGVCAPGSILARTDREERTAVIADVRTTTREGAMRRDFHELADAFTQALLAARDPAEGDSLLADGQHPVGARREAFEKRTGERVTLKRWRRLKSVGIGAVGAHLFRVTTPVSPGATRVRFTHSTAGALVSLAASESCTSRKLVAELADCLALHLLLVGKSCGGRGGQRCEREALLRAPLFFDPTITVSEAIEVTAQAVQGTVELVALERYALPDDGAPDRLPNEAALRELD